MTKLKLTGAAVGEFGITSDDLDGYAHLTDGDANEFFLTKENIRELITLLEWAEETL